MRRTRYGAAVVAALAGSVVPPRLGIEAACLAGGGHALLALLLAKWLQRRSGVGRATSARFPPRQGCRHLIIATSRVVPGPPGRPPPRAPAWPSAAWWRTARCGRAIRSSAGWCAGCSSRAGELAEGSSGRRASQQRQPTAVFAPKSSPPAFRRGRLHMVGLDLDGKPLSRCSTHPRRRGGGYAFKTALRRGASPAFLARDHRRGATASDACTSLPGTRKGWIHSPPSATWC